MMQKKICLLGAFAVGKTSMVRRFVQGVFSERYLTTIGVKIDRKRVRVGTQEIQLLLWDLAGEDAFHRVATSYLRGAAGCLLVVDGTRPDTLAVARELEARALAAAGQVPCIVALNKADLESQWLLDEGAARELEAVGLPTVRTSAATGCGIEEAFQLLAERSVRG
jgi:small GTP-binding protein